MDEWIGESKKSGNFTFNSEVSETIKPSQKESESFYREIDRLKEQVDSVSKNAQKEANDLQARLIEVLGVFAALFTFISVEVQIFRQLTSWESFVGITLIIAGVLMGFVLALSIAFKQERWKLGLRYSIFFGISIFGIVAGIVFASIGGSQTVASEKQDFSEKFLLKEDVRSYFEQEARNVNLLEKDFQDFKNCILRKGPYECSL